MRNTNALTMSKEEKYLNECFLLHYEHLAMLRVYRICYRYYLKQPIQDGQFALLLLRCKIISHNIKLRYLKEEKP